MSHVGSMSKRAASGAVMVGLSQGLRVALSMASIVVVSRILSPRDYGIVAMAAPVLAFIAMFQNIGLDQAVAQSHQISEKQMSALFWINIAVCSAAALCLVSISPAVGWFYKTPEAGYFVAASALTVLIGSPALLHSALLNRELRFGAICAVDVVSSVTVFAVTIVSALVLRSYWALWVGGVVGGLASLTVLWTLQRWRPEARPAFRGAGEMLRFGRGIAGFNIINFFARNLDNILIARRWGGSALGLYDRAYKLMMFPLQNINGPIAGVMLPILGRLRTEPERYRHAYVMAVRGIQLLAIPGVAVAIATNDRLITFLLGSEWDGVSPIFFWLSIGALIQPSGNPTGWLFISSNRTHEYMMWGVFSSVTSVIAFLIGLPHGPVGVAACYVIADWARVPLQLWWAARKTPVRVIDLWSMHGPTAVLLPIVLGLNYALDPLLETLPLLIVLTAASYATMVGIYGCLPVGRELLSKGWSLRPLGKGKTVEQQA